MKGWLPPFQECRNTAEWEQREQLKGSEEWGWPGRGDQPHKIGRADWLIRDMEIRSCREELSLKKEHHGAGIRGKMAPRFRIPPQWELWRVQPPWKAMTDITKTLSRRRQQAGATWCPLSSIRKGTLVTPFQRGPAQAPGTSREALEISVESAITVEPWSNPSPWDSFEILNRLLQHLLRHKGHITLEKQVWFYSLQREQVYIRKMGEAQFQTFLTIVPKTVCSVFDPN